MQTRGSETLRPCRSRPPRDRERCQQEHRETVWRKNFTHRDRDTQRDRETVTERETDSKQERWREGDRAGDIRPFTSFLPPRYAFWARPWGCWGHRGPETQHQSPRSAWKLEADTPAIQREGARRRADLPPSLSKEFVSHSPPSQPPRESGDRTEPGEQK